MEWKVRHPWLVLLFTPCSHCSAPSVTLTKRRVLPTHIAVNAYAPGIVDTPMWDKVSYPSFAPVITALADRAVHQIDLALGPEMGLQPGEARKKYVDDLILLKRLSVPEDVAKLVSWLASDEAE